jgi:AraC family transcriptional regulator of adaptative response/methylated-DNA-[protein]-cysteine methyltransferase
MSHPQSSEPRHDDLARWSAVLSHDSGADGSFVYAVRSTGIYCKPSCPSRRPRRDRVEFFANNCEVAVSIGQPRAVRAVAHACAANPVSLVIPCHRVVRTSGSLAGYRWGIVRKKALLAAEHRMKDR